MSAAPQSAPGTPVLNVQEAKTHLSRLVDRAAAGEEIIIGKYGKPLARLTAFTAPDRERPLGGLEGHIHLAAEFDDEDPQINALFST